LPCVGAATFRQPFPAAPGLSSVLRRGASTRTLTAISQDRPLAISRLDDFHPLKSHSTSNQSTIQTPMKRRHLIPIIALTSLAAFCWTAVAAPEKQDSAREAEITPESPAEKEAAAIQRMETEQERISERLQISAPMEVELVNGVDPVMEAYENGFIIEATLEQVEAALAAAAKTPDLEDDLKALELKHRGSYRFFAPDSVHAVPENGERK
jgi:hypothetical protein